MRSWVSIPAYERRGSGLEGRAGCQLPALALRNAARAGRVTWLNTFNEIFRDTGSSAIELRGGNAFKRPAKPRVVRHAQQGAEQQRIQELLGELAMADPVVTVVIAAERQEIDEDRARTVELDVVGARVRELDAVGQRVELQVEVQQRGSLERAEGPLIGVRDVPDRCMFDDVPDVSASEGRGLADRPLRRSELARVHQPVTIHPPLQEAGIPDVLVMDCGRAIDRAEDSAVVMVDVTGRVTEGGRVPDDHDPSRLLFSFMRRLIVIRAAACARKHTLPP